MTPTEIDLVEASFAKVAPISASAATLFYGRLFETAPETRPLFREPLDAQGRKLMKTLGVVVNGLGNLDSVLPTAAALARRHVEYGVKAEHYLPVGAALVWTLEQGLGEDFTEDVRQAWLNAYSALSAAMINAAYPEAAE